MGAHLIRWREEWQRGEGNWELLPLTVVPHRGCHRQLSSGRLSVFVLLHILINRLQEQLTQPEMEPALGRARQTDSEPDLEQETEHGQDQEQSKAKSPQSREHNKKIHDHKYPAGVKRSHRFRRRRPRRLCPSLPLALILSTQLVLLVASTFDLICSFSARTQDSQLELAAQFFCDLCLYIRMLHSSPASSRELPSVAGLALFLCLLVALFISHFRIPFLFLFLSLLLHFQAIK